MRHKKKLTDEQIRDIRAAHQKGATTRALAQKYDVSQGHISDIVTGSKYQTFLGSGEREAIAKAYAEGATMKDLSRKYKVSLGQVSEVCAKVNRPKKKKEK